MPRPTLFYAFSLWHLMDVCSLCFPMFVSFHQSLYSFIHCHQLYQWGKYGRTDVGNRSRRSQELAASWFLVLSSQKNWINAAACCGDQLTHSVHGDSTQITALNTSANKTKTGDQRKETIIILSSKQKHFCCVHQFPCESIWVYFGEKQVDTVLKMPKLPITRNFPFLWDVNPT